MIHSRIISKAQTTIPRAVRVALGLRQGDELAYEIDGNRVILTRRATSDPFDDLFAMFTEWAGEADKAYDVLWEQFPRARSPSRNLAQVGAAPLAPGDLVWVPFPRVEDNRLRSRPAVILATGLAGKHELCWALRVTAAANEP